MSYNTTLKMNSPMKQTINTFLASYSTPETNALVIDAETLLTSSELVSYGVDPINIVVVNNDESVIQKAHSHGHKKSVAGFSTNVISSMTNTFDIIYLDYCGTPDGNKTDGVFPKYDLLWAADRLSNDGIVLVTFSRRNHEGYAVERAQSMIPLTMELINVVYYCESSPMFVLMLVKKDFQKKRYLRDEFNRIKMEVHDQCKTSKRKRVEEPPVVPKRPKVSECQLEDLLEKDSDEAYQKRLAIASPERYSIIGYYNNGFMWKGIVQDVLKDGRIKILWVDSKDKIDYGKSKGYNLVGAHIDIDDPDHDKAIGNWCYLYDTYSKDTVEEAEEMEPFPITMNRKEFIELKEKVAKDAKYTTLLEYFGIDD